MQMKKCLLIISICLGFITLSSNTVLAIPSLGVASSTRVYAYTDPDALTDEYINYFADTIVPAVGAQEGFLVGHSGVSTLTVFTSYDPSATQLYLLADTAGNHLPMKFGTQGFIKDTTGFISGQADGYIDMPYSYVALPHTGWTTHAFSSGTYNLYEATIEYVEPWTMGYYFFSAAETNGVIGLQYAGSGGRKDDFSPKTTSAGGNPTPEPATMVLFGLGALGFGVVRKRRK